MISARSATNNTWPQKIDACGAAAEGGDLGHRLQFPRITGRLAEQKIEIGDRRAVQCGGRVADQDGFQALFIEYAGQREECGEGVHPATYCTTPGVWHESCSNVLRMRLYRAAALILLLLLAACARRPDPLPGFPRVLIWVWERPEDLTWLDTRTVGVAFLARTVCPREDGVAVRPRRQPLRIPPGAMLMAVVRVESGGRAATADVPRTGRAIADAASLPGVRALQVDFDAVASERTFYRALLQDVRRRLPPQMPLSITALASWCEADGWIAGLPVAEAVPMLFRMGPDHYTAGNDFRGELCRSSAGVSTDELPARIPSGRRVYVFDPRGWTADHVQAMLRKVGQWQSAF